jgi:endonuclease G
MNFYRFTQILIGLQAQVFQKDIFMRLPPRIPLGRVLLSQLSLALIVICSQPDGLAQVCSGCEVSKQTITKSDALLNLSSAEKTVAEATHLFGGRPIPINGATHEHMIHQREWVTWYDDDLRLPLWVGYQLSKSDASKQLKRLDCFRVDPRLAENAASNCDDYDEPVFDRGHMVPNADMSRGRLAMTNSFIFSNMTPQQAKFNQGIWARFESKVRKWAVVSDGIFIVTGAVFDKNSDGKRDDDDAVSRVSPVKRVGIPTHFYKIILHVRPDGSVDTITILLPNVNKAAGATDPFLAKHITTIDAVEGLTGINFFPQIPKDKQAIFEAFKAPGLWKMN